ncbi:MAG: hypothetical protein DI533_11030 [Cereibacter sphaeroides]|uniref:DUF2157 domain-containing protein n=1 Tax=Cereibacter sphaeroides TaxID=1063 RepID=A0A2W5S7A0_CERSP|nr:MAG: hypothetical protein DI533_11030 [Cereibacter sphaeroides]
MADELRPFGNADLRAAVAANILTEAQAASVIALADDRAGRRVAMPAEDEPFEFFRGFSEIFVSIGLLILFGGVAGFVALVGGIILLPLICAAIAWWWAGYFTLKRRMNLPSMVLAVTFGAGLYTSAVMLLVNEDSPRFAVVASFLIAAAGMALWYRRFRLPFSAFVLGCFLLGAIYTTTASFDSLGGFIGSSRFGVDGLFDLRESPQFALATLGFGIGAFLVAMWFDTCDPHRLGRHAATAFWLHMLAAPALVNTVALTLYNVGGALGIVTLALSLVAIAAMALVIDRRSFLTAAIGYIAIVLGWIVRSSSGDSAESWTLIAIVLGAFVTALGTWWVPLRSALMRALPDFPGKSRLPPYAETK